MRFAETETSSGRLMASLIKFLACWKRIGSQAVYTSSIQAIYSGFDNFLTEQSDFGFCIADSRSKPKNVNVSHSIFTQEFQLATSFYSRVLELPTFSHSGNHSGLQLCDLLCSALSRAA